MQLVLSVEILDDIVKEAVAHIERTHQNRHIRIDMRDEIIPVNVDANLIVQVIVNLIDNSIKYSEDDTDITVLVRRLSDSASVSVIDNGMGIPGAEKDKVFEMFYTLGNRSSDSRRSLGLGLSLCRSIIASHGGVIKIEDNTPSGTIVSFTLPLGDVELNE